MPFLNNSEIRFELEETSRAIEESIGILPAYFRAPFGLCNRRVFAEATKLGLTTVRWDVRATDWAMPGVDVISHRIIKRAHPEGVILLHDGGGDRSQTVAALPAIIETLQQQGYQFVTLDEIRKGNSRVSAAVPRITDSLVRDLPLVHDLFADLRQRTNAWIASKR
jgi:peptidoglycan/xylan/chitin deacetylase (PgdA/CDA1 family)